VQFFLETADPSSHMEARCSKHKARVEHELTFLEALVHDVHKL
jgi:hypothetical protein